MIVLKLILKIVCIPIVLVLTVIQLVLTFLTAMTGWFFHLLALIVFVTGVLSWGFGLENSQEIIRMMIISFILFLIPYIAEKLFQWISEIVSGVRVL